MKMKSRKEKRKEFRKAKKLKKHEFFSKKKQKTNKGNNNFSKNDSLPKGKLIVEKKVEQRNPLEEAATKSSKKENVRKEFKNPHEKWDYEREKEKKERETLNREIRKQRIKKLKMDNMKEDIEIKKLEKQLKMNKGKSKAFALDGLDYLLDICDKDDSKNEFMKTLDDTDSEFESDLDNIFGTPNKKETKSKKEKKIKDKKITKSKDDSKKLKTESETEQESEVEEESDDIDDDHEGTEMSEESEAEDEEEFDDNESEKNDDNLDIEETGKKRPNTKNNNKRKKETSNNDKRKKVKFEDDIVQMSGEEEFCEDEDFLEEAEDDDENEDEDFLEEAEDDDENEDEEEEEEKEEKTKSPEASKVWEDIYGRTRDEKGNVVKTYTPPQLRKKLGAGGEGNDKEKTSEKLERLKKQLKGLLNRLSESNMAFISNQIEQLYMSNSRNDMNETLCKLFTESLMTEVLTPERLITEHAMLVAVLHSNIGSEISAHFLQYAVTEFSRLLESNPSVEDKKINNILVFIMHLYNFQIFHSKLMYDILNELLKNLEEKQIELLLTTLRTVGFSLRKDDPLALKAFIIKVQEQANGLSSGENSSRVKFMLEMLMAIKNNNVSKIPNYNPEVVERMRKNLKVLVRKGNFSTPLNISLQDLLKAEERGRWWIVGSAWSGSAPTQSDSNEMGETESSSGTEFSQKLLELARKQRMNTDVRRNVFCILMSAEDFLEAFEKLLKLKLKGTVEREIMNVLIHCALQEKNFNPYYVYVANKFCTFDRKYQMMLQCALWDKIKELKNLLPVQVTNLAKFVGNVILEKGLPISVLKVIQFSELDKPTIKFMRQVLLAILVAEDRNASIAVFKRIAESSKLKMFRESLRLFLQHFVLKNVKNVEEGKVSRLVDMVKVAEQALTSSDVKMIF